MFIVALILDWFGDTKASEWTYLAARLRCAAKYGDIKFGAYIVPRGPTGGVAHGTVGLLKKAIALIGSGASALDWFEFGPEGDSNLVMAFSCAGWLCTDLDACL
eukprot:SAG31_NODE_286_length_18467_cov_41.317056_12_plen_104_part_00